MQNKFFKYLILSSLVFSSLAFGERARLLATDQDALLARANLIAQAKSEIMAEYFSVWNDEESLAGLTKLLRAAQRGLDVKIIIDSMSNKVPPALLTQLQEKSINEKGEQKLQIKVYNKFHALRPLRAFNRDHAKLLIGDFNTNYRVILGGRNVGDKYFSANKKRNFRDLDLLTEGQIAQDARASFMKTWESSLVSDAKFYNYENNATNITCANVDRTQKNSCELRKTQLQNELKNESKRIEQATSKFKKKWKKQFDQSRLELAEVDNITKDWLQNSKDYTDFSFFSNGEEKLVDESNLEVTDALKAAALLAEHSIDIVNPYFLPIQSFKDVFKLLIAKKVKIRIITNSLASTDNFLVQNSFQDMKEELVQLGLEIYAYNGPDTMHAKAALIDNKTLLIGTYNLDPRSANINRELGVMITDTENGDLASSFNDVFAQFQKNSVLIAKDGQAYNSDQWDQNVSATDKALYYLLKPLTYLLKSQL